MPSISNLHIDTFLTNVSVMYQNDEAGYAADAVFPEIPVDKQSDKYPIYGQENLRADDDLRAPGGEADEMNWSLSTDSYYCDGHARSAVIPDEWRENEDAVLDVDVDTTTMLTDQIYLRREVDAYTQVNAGLAGVDLSGSKWDNDANDPVKVIDAGQETIRKATGKRGNTLLLPEPVFRGIRNNALVKARISGAQNLEASLITVEQLAGVLGVNKIVLASAVYATSKEGQAQTNDYVWGKNALLFYTPPSPGKRTVSLGYRMTWNKGRLGAMVYRFRLDSRHSDKIEVMRYYAQKIVAAGAGVWWNNVIA